MKKSIPYAFSLALVLLMAYCSNGCKSKQPITKIETKKVDSVYIKTEVIKSPVLTDILTIQEICDTVTGEVIRFKKVFVINGDSIEILTNEKNELNIKLSQLSKELKRKDSISQSKSVSEKSDKLRIEYRTPKIWYYISGALLLGWIFPAIPRFLNGVFKKIVGLF